ncbi:MAG: hypothetical protein F2658_01610 [Actinobacteria bacterium]|uniref:Unannotated protein n=1 Tax=freshwater metagenome TaxID=449393 RepID=A0A6J6N5Q8_9ZZZZ|nr:hypothetical protein [Actinomycetota bacterium]
MSFRNQRIFLCASILIFSIPTASYAQILIGYNTDGTPMYGPAPQGATGPIATPENPFWMKNPDGTPTEAEKNYTFIPNAEEKARNNVGAESELNEPAPPGMIHIGYNTDGTPKFAAAPQGATGPIATPENPFWIKNPDGTQTAAEKNYVFLPNADERAKSASLLELKKIVENEISTSKFVKVNRSGGFVLTSTLEVSAASSVIKALAIKKGAKSQSISLSFNEDGQLIIKASDKLKGYQVQVTSEGKVLKKITL